MSNQQINSYHELDKSISQLESDLANEGGLPQWRAGSAGGKAGDMQAPLQGEMPPALRHEIEGGLSDGAQKNSGETFELVPSESALASLEAQGGRLWAELRYLLLRIDLLINKADLVLDRLQPSHNGKIRIAWWESRAGMLHGSAPTPVIWNRSRKSGKWLATRVSPVGLSRRVKVTRGFYDNREQVRETAQMLSALFAIRSRIVMLMSAQIQAVDKIATMNRPRMAEVEATLNALLEFTQR